MNNKFNKTIEQLKSIKMTPEEKSKILLSLKSTMEYNPVRSMPIKTIRQAHGMAPYFFGMQFGKFATVMAVALIVVLGSGASGAAANSIPGDLLYPIKININEKLQLTLTKNPINKIKLEQKLLVTRLTEIQKLSNSKNLNEKSVTIAERGLTRQTDILNDEILKLRNQKNDSLAIKISDNMNQSFTSHEISPTSLVPEKNNEFKTRLQSIFIKNSSKAFALRNEFNKKETVLTQTKDQNEKELGIKEKETSTTAVTSTQTEPKEEVIVNTEKDGLLKGTVTIGPLCPVENATHPCDINPEVYTGRRIYVYSKDNKYPPQILQLNDEGFFEISLKPGEYTIRSRNGMDTITNNDTAIVTSNGITTLNINIDTGIR